MIQLAVLVPLVAVGVVSAFWRNHKHAKKHQDRLEAISKVSTTQGRQINENSVLAVDRQFDDVGELDHYQEVSWYAFAFSVSGSWFYAPIAILSLPLLSYNSYHFVKTFRQASIKEQKSPISVFEVMSLSATLMLGHLAMCSALFLFSFGFRKLLLHAGNITNTGMRINPQRAMTWILRDGVEIESPISALQDGDIIVVHANDIILLKGKVLQGEGIVSQYSLKKTLKYLPKQVGDYVYPFTCLTSGQLYIQK